MVCNCTKNWSFLEDEGQQTLQLRLYQLFFIFVYGLGVVKEHRMCFGTVLPRYARYLNE